VNQPASRPGDAFVTVGLMIVCCALVAATILFAKMLGPMGDGPSLHPLQVTAGRFGFALVALAPFLIWNRVGLTGGNWGVHSARVVAGWAGVACMFAAAANMRLADATAITFLNPIVAMVLAVPLLGEKVGRWRWAAAATAFCGAVVLTNPGSGAIQPAALIALAAAFLTGLEIVLVKKLTGLDGQLRILAVGNLFGALIAVAAASFVWRAPTPDQWLLLAATGVAMVAAQALVLMAFRRGDASLVVPLFYMTLIFAGLYDFAVFSVEPGANSYIGIALILAAAILLAWRERVQRRGVARTQ
jgi:drug/metabolite transporter (DMT)-like permease